MALIQSTAIPSGATAYEIEQSLRLEDGSAAYLNRTPSSASNRKTWTWSGWVKRSNLALGTDLQLFSTNQQANPFFSLFFRGADTISFVYYNGTYYQNITTAVYRDSSSWYHIVFVFDTTQSTASDRYKLYVNGSLVTSYASSNYPPLNTDGTVNNNQIHYISKAGVEGTQYLDGYLAEVNFIDGLAKAPADFGETGTYGEWKPIEYEGSYGTNGFYLNFAGGGIMSATGGTITTDGDYKVHTFTSNGTFTPTVPGSLTASDLDYLVIAGGGGGGGSRAGGGGAGGYKTGSLQVVSGTGYSIIVGAGGAGGASSGANGTDGVNSVFSSITSTGGGGGGGAASTIGRNGGSGGGAATANDGGIATPSGQGNNGGYAENNASEWGAGGGGGAGSAGANATSSANGVGGSGLSSSITGSAVTRAGGGGGGGQGLSAGVGGSGGGGAGAYPTGVAGTANTGGGGGGGLNDGAAGAGGAGGSGIVILRYKFQ